MEMKGKMRRPYQKPQIHQVKLDLGEAVLQACKVADLQTHPSGPQKNRQCNHQSGCLQGTYGS